MNNKRHSDDPESSSSKRTQMASSSSILHYFKTHYTYQTFNSKDLLRLLNCDTPETAKKEAENQMNAIFNIKNVKDEVKNFVSCLLVDGLKCLSNPDADLYWKEKKSMAALLTSSHEQLQLYHGVSSSMINQTLLSVQRVIAETRSLSPASSVETESSLENIWSIWSSILYEMLTDDHNDTDINRYSLEYLGIIIMGEHIGNKQSRQLYPKKLVSKTNKILQVPAVDVFQKFVSFYPPFFESLIVSLDECHTLLLKNSLKVKITADPNLQFTFDFFMIFITQILKKPGVLTKQETVYNYRAIFRFLDAVVSAIPSCVFIPGETRLQAIYKELERQNMSTKSYYNADGIISDSDSGLELCLLETSGPFGLINVSRETTDQVKAAYGLLSMLHTIAHQFVHADIQTFQKLKICFLHAAQDRIRLWTFCLLDKELYVLNRVDSAVLPVSHSEDFQNQFMHVTNLFWKLKMLLDGAKSSLNEIEASHAKNEAAYRDGHVDGLPKLEHYLVENAEVKLSSRVSQASDIYISSSPIRPDSP
ncbi:uncharacterized protein ATC70_008735 [Mucor velutinosus]|uniref:Uncharacterized protein n=1 Tax=Mucor velutinosus TaxID=708070 RepID=A0AAN7DK93_9FUNG|nr:hypothetical protein ATC70_008735 [Mucor velutinosus]